MFGTSTGILPQSFTSGEFALAFDHPHESPLTFAELCEREPALRELEKWSNSTRVGGHVWNGCSDGYMAEFERGGRPCAKCRGGLRNHLYRLIGEGRPDGDSLLSSSRAWDIAVAVLYFKIRSRRVLGAKRPKLVELPKLEGSRVRPGGDFERDLANFREYRQRHPLCYPATTKERPRCRREIIENSLKPYPAPDCWDGFSALSLDGEPVFLSDGMKAQMRKMLAEGYFKTRGETNGRH